MVYIALTTDGQRLRIMSNYLALSIARSAHYKPMSEDVEVALARLAMDLADPTGRRFGSGPVASSR